MSGAPPAGDLEVVDGFIEAFNEGDVDGCIALTTPDVVMTTAREWPGGGCYTGTAEVRAFLEEFLGDWQRIRYEHQAPEAVAGRIVERARWVGVGRTSGIESSVDFYTTWTVTAGAIARLDVFALREEARSFAQSGGS